MQHRRRMLVVAGRQLAIDAPCLDIRGEGANRRAYWICPAPARDHFSPIIQRLNYNLDDEEEVQQMAERCRFLWNQAIYLQGRATVGDTGTHEDSSAK